jgi:hypothetical protein
MGLLDSLRQFDPKASNLPCSSINGSFPIRSYSPIAPEPKITLTGSNKPSNSHTIKIGYKIKKDGIIIPPFQNALYAWTPLLAAVWGQF